jgi:hypothetical protein
MNTHAPIRVAVPLVAALCALHAQASPNTERLSNSVILNGITDTVRWADGLLQERARLGSGFYCNDGEKEEAEPKGALDFYLGSDFSWLETEGAPTYEGDVYRPTLGLDYQLSDKFVIGAAYTHTTGNYEGAGGFTAENGMNGGSFYAWYLPGHGARLGAALNYTEGETDFSDPNFGVTGASWETFRGGSVTAGYGRMLGTPGEIGGNFFFDLSGSFLFSHREVLLDNGGTMNNYDYSDVFFAGRTQFGTQLSSCCSVYGLFNVFTQVASEDRARIMYPFNGVGGINTMPPEADCYGEVGAGVNWCINDRFNLNFQGVTSVFNDGWNETRGTLFANFRF